ncbi:prolipoprotein diacylglyceryl transferase [soil metagenome]
MIHPAITVYSVITLVAMIGSLLVWRRIWKNDARMVAVYFGALFGSLIGAKVVYLAAEGWMQWGGPLVWQQWLTGKSIVGALAGGYVGVELAKSLVGYRKATGDNFALVVPLAIAFGRIGCLLQGCCLGRVCEPAWWTLADARGFSRWPAVPVEILFNLIFAAVVLLMRGRGWARGQQFHIYLMAYGAFRILHEPLRATPTVVERVTGYQIAAGLLFLIGLVGYVVRARGNEATQGGLETSFP